MKIYRWDSTVLLNDTSITMREAVIAAVDSDADLSKALLSRADLSGANLRRANFLAANLSGADLSGANLRGANFSRADLNRVDLRAALLICADLSGADLSNADLRGADLRHANLLNADLSGANLSKALLRGALLSGADLRGADLSNANLRDVKNDFFKVLRAAPKEIAGLRAALVEGRVEGSFYEGTCACLIGTIANIRGQKYDSLDGLKPNASRPAERLFAAIGKGDIPDSNPIVKLVLDWIDEYEKIKFKTVFTTDIGL